MVDATSAQTMARIYSQNAYSRAARQDDLPVIMAVIAIASRVLAPRQLARELWVERRFWKRLRA